MGRAATGEERTWFSHFKDHLPASRLLIYSALMIH